MSDPLTREAMISTAAITRALVSPDRRFGLCGPTRLQVLPARIASVSAPVEAAAPSLASGQCAGQGEDGFGTNLARRMCQIAPIRAASINPG